MKLYILRHGETDYNDQGRFQGQNDISLNKRGKKQAEETRVELKEIKFDKVFVSPLKRAIETAQIVVPDYSLEVDSRIIERSFGKLEGQKGIQDYEDRIEEFKIESILELEQRVKAFIENISNKYKNCENILVVTHGGIAQIINKLLDEKYNNYNFKDFILENSKYICYEL